MCVCLSVKSHLTYRASVRPENAVTYSAGNEGQKICGVFSENALLLRSSRVAVVFYTFRWPFLTLGAHAQRGLQYLGLSCLSLCLSVCLLSHISPMEHLFDLKTLPRTQRAMKVKKFLGICLKRLRSGVVPRNRGEKANMLIIPTYPRSAFSS